MILQFGEFAMDTDRYELRRSGELRKLERKVFDLIVHFARHPGQMFSRDELVQAVWHGRVVSDATVSTCIKSARKALGDSGATQRFIQTVRGRGFRFCAEVAAGPVPDGGAGARSHTIAGTDRRADPSLLVLPFRALSGEPATVQLASGLTDDLLTILTRIPLLRLSAHTHHYAGRGVMPSARELHEELGVDLVLESSVQALGAGHRLNVALADAASGFRVWSDRVTVSGTAETALATAAIGITAKLEPQLYRAIYQKVISRTHEHDGRALFLEASAMLALKGWRHDTFAAAAQLLRRSWQREPGFALAPAYLSLVLGLGHRIGLSGEHAQARSEALAAADRALELDGMDSTVLGYAGCALADIGQPERALPILKNAVEINPANAQAWAALGSVCLLQQRIDESIGHLQHGISISPLDSRLAIWGSLLTLALLRKGDIAQALQQGELACQRDDRCYIARVVLAGVHFTRGEQALARAALDDAYRIKPDLSESQVMSLLGKRLGATLAGLLRPPSGAA